MKTMGHSPLRYPAQWEPHLATVLATPFDNDLWFGRLNEVRAEHLALTAAIAAQESVVLVVPPEELAAHGADFYSENLPDSVTLLPFQLNDIWVRDSGPVVLTGGPSQHTALDFIFNAWGEKFFWDCDNGLAAKVSQFFGMERRRVPLVFEGGSLDVNGAGAALTTSQCLLEKNRNPRYSKQELHALLCALFGLTELIWLENGLEGDHTDGHIDTIARFVNEQTVVCHVATSNAHPSFQNLEANYRALSQLAQGGKSAVKEVIALPVPSKVETFEGEVVPFSYANFYFAGHSLLVPQFGDPMDDKALEILTRACPRHRVLGLSARAIILGGGVFNCLTQQIPAQIPVQKAD